MNVKINSVHFKADRKLEAFIQEKVSKLTQYFDGIVSA
ncbi:MAG: HPF/RaiA family ribosome-associated protein, partial [Bacteroidales bacterium]|nr:HPF/RaiA family ribosome-associated protein [Bacteroidales bacterium]